MSEALAFYDVLAERGGQSPGIGTRDDARRQALEAHSQWADELREHFRLEDCLLGVTDSPFDSTQLGLPADPSQFSSHEGAQESAASENVRNRYATAKDLAADVTRWLADEPVTAWPEPPV